MLELTFGEQVKIILSRKGMTIKELAEKIEKQTGKKMSRQNLTQRLGRDNFQEQDMRMIAKILDCPFYLDILEEHEEHEEKLSKAQKIAEPEKKKTPAKAEERDITIGELVDIHKELDAIEKKKKKKSKKVVEPDPEYVQETIFDFVREKEATAEPATEIEEQEEEIQEPVEETGSSEAVTLEAEESVTVSEEEPAAGVEEHAEKPVYEDEPVYESKPEYAEEPAYESELEYAEEPAYESEPKYTEESAHESEPEVEEPEEPEKPEPKKVEPEKKAHGWRALFGIRKKHEEESAHEEPAKEEKPEIQYHEFDYSGDGESEKLAEEFMPEEPEQEETYAAADETSGYENNGYQSRYAQENEEDLFTSDEEDLSKGELNPYTGHEYESNSVRMHPKRIGYVQVYDRGKHQWTDMTEWAFLGYQERKKALLGKDYEPPIYLD